MESQQAVERFDLSVQTPAGPLVTTVEIPAGFVPVTEIVPLARRLGEQALAMEERKVVASGKAISCTKGCAACCRMLVPVSAPEAFALSDAIASLPEERRQKISCKLAEAHARLERTGLFQRLWQLAETDRPITDEEMDPLNRDYYALRMPCPFLEQETCSIYDDRPAACRELLVTSPAELCQDMIGNPVQPLPVPIRVSTILGLTWAELTNSPPRLIPLPVALAWADRHASERRSTWKAHDLLEKILNTIWRFLGQAMGR